jgi:hypothetical protein
VFALVAGLSLLTKYLIRYRGPSSTVGRGLVAAFLLLGSTGSNRSTSGGRRSTAG